MFRIAGFLVLLLLPPTLAHGEVSSASAGIIMGEPTGISFKTWLNEDTALAAAAAWSFADGREAFHIHGDYLNHIFGLFHPKRGRMAVFYGFGARVKTEPQTRAGIRIPFGVTYIFEGAPLDIFFQIVPLLDMAPSTEANVNIGAGIGYYF